LALRATGNRDEAVKEFQEILQDHPDAKRARIAVIDYYKEAIFRTTDQAKLADIRRKLVTHYIEAARWHPENPQYIMGAIDVVAKLGDTTRAISLIQTATTVYKEDFAVQHNLAIEYLHINRPHDALEQAKTALRLAPSDQLRQKARELIQQIQEQLSNDGP